jgi:hypothetical protein
MSSIAKPLCNFTNSLNPNTYVPVEQVMTVEYIATPATSVTGPVQSVYSLLFTMFDPNNPRGGRNITINFSTSAAAQTSLANFKTDFSLAVA